MSHIFISYSHFDSDIAFDVRQELTRAGFDVTLDDYALERGREWRERLDRLIRQALAVVVVVTDNAVRSDEVTYEWSYALGRDVAVIPLIFGRIAAAHKNHRLVAHLNHWNFAGAADRPWADLFARLRSLPHTPDLRDNLHALTRACLSLEQKSAHMNNVTLRHVITESLRGTTAQLTASVNDMGASYSVSATQYPDYLISLQKEHRARVRAIAWLDEEERFWQQDTGRRIAATSRPNSTRVFVFADEYQFNRAIGDILGYASKYLVYGISRDNLQAKFPQYAKDFSIIEIGESKMVANYDESSSVQMIQFSADWEEVTRYERALSKIVRAATRIEATKNENRTVLRQAIFSKLTKYPRELVEMSKYIPIDDYDEYEERHAYYPEMMAEMVAQFASDRPKDTNGSFSRCRVLELGAGTGLFTRRIAEHPDVECVAVEIDFVCLSKLARNTRYYSHVEVLAADSRTFGLDGAPGRFSYIFSSFSDHHIRPEDREQYLNAVKHNLTPNGKFIVGDEFLPPHDPDDVASWSSALRTYHGHIIDQALGRADSLDKSGDAKQAAEYRELAKLEQAALESGLERIGDFKVSCAEYEKTLRQAGLKFTVDKIGPKGADHLGGVYVYVAWL